MTKKQHYMTEQERYTLEGMLRAGKPVAWIARELGFTRQTIYNEIRRGSYHRIIQQHGYYQDIREYSADKGQQIYERNQRVKGRPLKIGKNRAFADFLEDKILHDHFSPAAALADAYKRGYRLKISVQTVYNYIDQGLFLELTNADLWEKPTRKPRQKKKPQRKAHPQLPSIEDRPEHINNRRDYGHWEMDLVVGPDGSRACLLTLTERKTRQELIFKIPNRKALSVRRVFNRLERELPNFREIFKSVTTDNGNEFMEYEKLRRSIHGGKRFDLYYCHSYASWEKGSNENHNRMIRRFFPKGTAFEKVSRDQIAEVQHWMNHYPRKILQWKTPVELAA